MNERDDLKSKNDILDKKVNELENTIEELKKQAGNSQNEKKLKEELSAANSKNVQLNKDIDELTTAYDELDKSRKALEKECSELKSRKSDNDKISKELSEKKTALDKKQNVCYIIIMV